MFQVRQAQGDMGAAEDDTQWHDEHFMLSYIFFCVCVCGMRQPAHSIFLRVSVGAEVAGSRAGELPKAEYTSFLFFLFFLNTLQRWINRTPPTARLFSVNTASFLPVCSQHRP